MDFIIFDLEATCWQNKPPSIPQEIIEFGAYRLSPDGEARASFQTFVRPILHPRLSPFCQQLTSIEQDDIDQASAFSFVVESFIDFIGYNDDEDYMLCSWGDFDLKQLERDCDLHRVDKDWLHPHINLRAQYQRIERLSKPRGLASAVRNLGLEWDGAQHRALDDAKNLVRVFRAHIDEWVY